MPKHNQNRREFLQSSSVAAMVAAATATATSAPAAHALTVGLGAKSVSRKGPPPISAEGHGSYAPQPDFSAPLKGHLRQSVCQWCYGSLSIDDLCKAAADIGLKAIDLLHENEWDIPSKHGLVCAIGYGPVSIAEGINRPESHPHFIKESERLLPLMAKSGVPQMIIFSGNRRGMSDGDGLKNCAEAIRQIMPAAKETGVRVIMELLNSKVDHHDYQCDHTAWGVELVKRVGSDHFRLLYDIYHMQIMEGDVIRTIGDNFQYISHYHTGGIPGRHEIDQSQELYYPAVCSMIVDFGFTGYLAQEFIPERDPLTSLRECAHICDV